MKQLTREQAIRYFQRIGIKDRGDIYKFLYELSEVGIFRHFINPADISAALEGGFVPQFAPQITSLNPTQHIELAQLLRKVARIIELSDVAFPR